MLGGGGYVAGPVGLAARLLRLPLVLTEADSHLGVTNRLLAPFAKRVFLAFPIEGRGEGPRAARRVGASGSSAAGPCRPATGRADRAAARARFGIGPRRAVRARVRRVARRPPAQRRRARGVRRGLAVRRPARQRAARLRRAARGAWTSSARPPHYHLHPYIEPFADALAAADLVVARAGGSVMEMAAAGLPSVLVPYPHATADHQTANARFVERRGRGRGGARTRSSTGRGWRARSGRCWARPSGWRRWPRRRAAVARPDAAERIAGELLALAG